MQLALFEKLTKAHKVLLLIPLVLYVLGIIFRQTLYWKLPVAPGDAYGIADILEVIFFFLILLACGIDFIFGLVLIFKKSTATEIGIIFLVWSLILGVSYSPVHSFVINNFPHMTYM